MSAALKTAQRPVQFLFTGHPNGWETFQKDFGHLPIRHLGFVRPALLRKLLESARALVFFSLHEGFGMPLLEAFDAGTPVLCSNTTSLPEVGGDAVLSCDPTDEDAMSKLDGRNPVRAGAEVGAVQQRQATAWPLYLGTLGG